MTGMPLHIGWSEIALRLVLTIIAGLLIGYNRTEYGKAAGLRTTLLVCLAASVAMIQVNLLLPTAGRASDSFVMNDLMRLPLGILTGVGFIGAGAIIRRDDLVVGVTSAATLWSVTVIGLCFGGGQLRLGGAATVIALAALWALHWGEARLRRERRASLLVEVESGGLNESAIRGVLEMNGMRIVGSRIAVAAGARREIAFKLLEYSRPNDFRTPAFCDQLAGENGVLRLEWKRE
jgi:putative Mg2+ transporter-C (MgtC) family protein